MVTHLVLRVRGMTATEILRPEIVTHTGPRRERLEVLVGAFLASYENKLTIDAYRRDLHKWIEFAKAHHIDVLDARRSHIDLYVRFLEDTTNLMPTSINRRLTALASFYTWMLDEEYIDRTPMTRVRRPKIPTDVPRSWMGRHQLADWLDAGERIGGYDYALACLLATNGLRIGEVIRSDIEDLGSERHHTTLRIMGKGSKPALIPLTARTVFALELAHDGRESGPLILNRYGNRLNRENAGRTVRRLCKAAGIEKHLTPHSLRRSAITGLLQDGADLRAVQDFARHADPKTTRGYDMAKGSLDGHGVYRVEQYIAAGSDR